jgi:L-tyrosine isonitrile synthase
MLRNAQMETRRPFPGARCEIAIQAENIGRCFNTWAYKRQQPSDLQLLHAVIEQAIRSGGPISFILYWGKGPRSRAGGPELQCLDFLQSLTRRIADAYSPGADLTLLQTDTHALLNGHPPEDIDSYFADIDRSAKHYGFLCRRLSSLVEPAEADEAKAPIDAEQTEVLKKLSKSASKWFLGSGSSAVGAQMYYRLNQREKMFVERVYPYSIFITFNGSELRELFPNGLPIFYMYSIKKGVSVKPWFMQDYPVSLD